MFDQLLAQILASLIKGPPTTTTTTTTTTTKQNVYPAVHCVYSRVKTFLKNTAPHKKIVKTTIQGPCLNIIVLHFDVKKQGVKKKSSVLH
jgi:hypothetical protein